MSKYIDNTTEQKGAVILAGGDSKRLGQPKALLDFQGKALIELMVGLLSKYFGIITVVTDRPKLYRHLPVTFTQDIINEEKSPLRGIHAGLSVSGLPYQFVVACDMPFLNLELIHYMSGFAAEYDAVVPRIGKYYQPLHAFYSRSCLRVIEKQLKMEHFKVTELYKHLKIRFISAEELLCFDPAQEAFVNINTWSDYEYALKVFNKRQRIGNKRGGGKVENS